MQCTILFFAHVAELANVRQTSLDLPPGATIKDALDQLCEEHPGIASLRSSISIAVNEKYVASHETPLNEGDTIALIPPVSGG